MDGEVLRGLSRRRIGMPGGRVNDVCFAGEVRVVYFATGQI